MAIYQNKLIKSLIGDVFSLDNVDYAILNKFAIEGESTRHHIVTTQDKKTVSKRIDILFNKDFLILRKKTPFRNQPAKSTKYFGLSLKGFLASLYYCNVENNYLVKKFLREIKDKKLSKLILCKIKNNLIHTLSYTSLMGITLDKIKNISSWLEQFHELAGLSNDDTSNLENLYLESEKTFQELRHYNFDNPNIFYYSSMWYSSIESFSNGMSYLQIINDLDKQFGDMEPLPIIIPDEWSQKLLDTSKII